jgi:hypothetical protein
MEKSLTNYWPRAVATARYHSMERARVFGEVAEPRYLVLLEVIQLEANLDWHVLEEQR